MFDEDVESAQNFEQIIEENKFLKDKIVGMLYIIEKANLPSVANEFKKQIEEKGINIKYMKI